MCLSSFALSSLQISWPKSELTSTLASVYESNFTDNSVWIWFPQAYSEVIPKDYTSISKRLHCYRRRWFDVAPFRFLLLPQVWATIRPQVSDIFRKANITLAYILQQEPKTDYHRRYIMSHQYHTFSSTETCSYVSTSRICHVVILAIGN
jgi:hypothetical protein